MADAAGKWSAATLTTLDTMSRIEREVTQLVSDGDTVYSVQDGNIATELDPDSIDVSDGKGITEIVGVAETELRTDTFSIAVTDSDDDVTFATFGTGLVLYAETDTVAAGTELFRYVIPSTMQDYFKPKITEGSSIGTISIYAVNRYANKIELAKEQLGIDLSEMLINNGILSYIDVDTDDVLDCVYEPSKLGTTSDLLTLSYIYRDLARGADENSLYWQKHLAYMEEYKDSLRKNCKLLVIDLTQDGNNLIYYSRMNYIAQAGR